MTRIIYESEIILHDDEEFVTSVLQIRESDDARFPFIARFKKTSADGLDAITSVTLNEEEVDYLIEEWEKGNGP